eukprot:TRINITY_DN8872_c0_g1_i2.p2 TRINITY_DN8872_c0_g1~~TRINITY_DN8872_c0_g1_i2.p2  ORF type:complete len:115 (+),score=12.31 TRINITY_DN8872_c0_g1_i2:544-888(+)
MPTPLDNDTYKNLLDSYHMYPHNMDYGFPDRSEAQENDPPAGSGKIYFGVKQNRDDKKRHKTRWENVGRKKESENASIRIRYRVCKDDKNLKKRIVCAWPDREDQPYLVHLFWE